MGCPNCGAPGGGVSGCGSCGLGRDPNVGGAFNAGQTNLQIERDRQRNSGGGGGGCFTLDTPILTPTGWQALGKIEPDHEILSYDPGSERVISRPVTAVKHYGLRRLWLLQTRNHAKPIKSTWSHPFMTSRGWKWTCALRLGDEFHEYSENGDIQLNVIESITPSDHYEPVCNLITFKQHNYFVQGALVHNFGYMRGLRSILSDLAYRFRDVSKHDIEVDQMANRIAG